MSTIATSLSAEQRSARPRHVDLGATLRQAINCSLRYDWNAQMSAAFLFPFLKFVSVPAVNVLKASGKGALTSGGITSFGACGMNFNPPPFFTSKGDLDFREITALTFESRGFYPNPSPASQGSASRAIAGDRNSRSLRTSDRAVSKQTTSSRSPKIQRPEGKQRFGQLSDALGDFRMCNDFGNHILCDDYLRAPRRRLHTASVEVIGWVRDVDRGVRFAQLRGIRRRLSER
ncbi:MAG: hypothetical protein WB766_04655 [Roseiarcus sp.]